MQVCSLPVCMPASISTSITDIYSGNLAVYIYIYIYQAVLLLLHETLKRTSSHCSCLTSSTTNNNSTNARADADRCVQGVATIDTIAIMESLEDEEVKIHSKIGRDLDAIVSTHMIMVVGVQFVLSILLTSLFALSRTADIDAQLQMLAIAHSSCQDAGAGAAGSGEVVGACAAFEEMLRAFAEQQAAIGTPLLYLSLSGTSLLGSEQLVLSLRQYPAQVLRCEINY